MCLHEKNKNFKQATGTPTVKQDRFAGAAEAGAPQDDHLPTRVKMNEESKYEEDDTAEAPQQETPWVNASEVFGKEEAQQVYENPQSVLVFVAPGSVINARGLVERLRGTKKVAVAKNGEEASQLLRHLSAPDIVFVENIDSSATAEYLSKLAPTMMIRFENSRARDVSPTSNVDMFFVKNGKYRQCLLSDEQTEENAAMLAEIVLFNPSLEIISVT